jgi:hypothetical protein
MASALPWPSTKKCVHLRFLYGIDQRLGQATSERTGIDRSASRPPPFGFWAVSPSWASIVKGRKLRVLLDVSTTARLRPTDGTTYAAISRSRDFSAGGRRLQYLGWAAGRPLPFRFPIEGSPSGRTGTHQGRAEGNGSCR